MRLELLANTKEDVLCGGKKEGFVFTVSPLCHLSTRAILELRLSGRGRLYNKRSCQLSWPGYSGGDQSQMLETIISSCCTLTASRVARGEKTPVYRAREHFQGSQEDKGASRAPRAPSGNRGR